MKIIIAYASAGGGHLKAAQAIYNYFKEKDPNLDIKLIDTLDYTTAFFQRSYIKGYNFLANQATWAWGIGFYLTNFAPLRQLVNWLHFFINKTNCAKLMDFLVSENPDAVISTHFLSPQIASYLKKRNKISSALMTVITDFGVHQFWLAEMTDTYFVASDSTRRILLKYGVAQQKIKVSGIPVDKKFSRQQDRKELFRKFNLDEHKFTVLVVTGSFGSGPLERIVDLLHADNQLLVVCARNDKLFSRLKNKNYPDLRVFGFVDNIEELMAVSSVIITKPGGLSASELLIMELPPIFITPIPGQETVNAHLLCALNIGVYLKDIRKVSAVILDYKNNPDKIKRIKEIIRQVKKPHSAEDIYNAVCQSSSRPSG